MMKSENGRSMVEMLGVLAIIGVLSVGAISGYSKAMFKYKLNKDTEQTSQILAAISRHLSDFHASSELNLIPIFNKLGEIPPEMIRPNTDAYIYNMFNMKIVLSKTDKYYTYWVNATDTDQNSEICINLFKTAQSFVNDIFAIGVNSTTADTINQQDWWYNDKSCATNNKCIRKMDLNDIYNLCKVCNKNSCGLYISFKPI